MGQLANAMRQIAEATKEQSVAVTSLATSFEQISVKTQSTDHASHETAEAIDLLSQRATSLGQLVGRLKI